MEYISIKVENRWQLDRRKLKYRKNIYIYIHSMAPQILDSEEESSVDVQVESELSDVLSIAEGFEGEGGEEEEEDVEDVEDVEEGEEEEEGRKMKRRKRKRRKRSMMTNYQ